MCDKKEEKKKNNSNKVRGDQLTQGTSNKME